MKNGYSISSFLIAAALGVSIAQPVFAAAPSIQTDGPIIHLADNLDEKDNLGWCIDTLGREQSDALQVHSCKPPTNTSLDVNFTYEATVGQIRSATYDDQCATLNAEGSKPRFGLVDCNPNDAAQAFDYEAETGRLSPRGQAGQCLAAGAESASAGPYMSRALDLVACDDTPKALRTWVVRP